MANDREKSLELETSRLETPSFELVEGHGYTLCFEAEYLILDDIVRRKVGLINDSFLMKTTGYPVGVAVAEQPVDGGVIRPGVWYMIADDEQRREARRAINQVKTNLFLPGKTAMIQLRDVRERIHGRLTNREELMQEVAQAAIELSGTPRFILE